MLILHKVLHKHNLCGHAHLLKERNGKDTCSDIRNFSIVYFVLSKVSIVLYHF